MEYLKGQHTDSEFAPRTASDCRVVFSLKERKGSGFFFGSEIRGKET